MHRCAPLVVAALAVLAAPADALAQITRPFPATALRGELVVVQPPEALLNGQAVRLAPGARIRGENNLLLTSGAVIGQKLVVNYTQDSGGVLDVWVLTAEERARWPWPTTPAQAAAWTFDAASQTWSKP